MTCTDWTKKLRPASFRGVSFWVSTDSFKGGRRVKHHEFPHKEFPYNEDLGQKLRSYSVTAYVASDSADSEANALIAACTRKGPGSLVLPVFGKLRAVCPSISSDRSKDKNGYVGFSLEFVEDKGLGAILPLGMLGRLVEIASGGLLSAVASGFGGMFKTLGAAGFVLKAAGRFVSGFGRSVLGALGRFSLSGIAGSLALSAARRLITNALSLVGSGETGDRYESSAYIRQATNQNSPLPAAVFEVFEAARKALEPAEAVRFFEPFLSYGADLPEPPLLTPHRAQERQNQAALVGLIRQAAMANYAIAVTQKNYETRRQAVQARADVSELFDFELNRLSVLGYQGHDVWSALYELRGKTVELLSRQMADLAPVQFINAPQLMPSLFWAQRLYGDAARAGEIARRNRLKHPSFVPTDFEVLAR